MAKFSMQQQNYSHEMSATRVAVIYGAGGLGSPGTYVKVTDPAAAQELIDTYVKHGGKTIDTSRLYGNGTSEELLGRSDIHRLQIDTKVYPVSPGDHEPRRLKELFKESLKALGPHKIRVFYLHAADRSVPFEDTVKAVHELFQEGHFKEFGLSNFYSFEVAEIVGICRANSYILPTAYEGIYNFLDRTIESELIPCLRKFNIKLATYSPLAGGFLTGIHLDDGLEIEEGSHFDPSRPFGAWFSSRYFPMHPEVRRVKAVADKHGPTMAEVAMRWLQHHSVLRPDDLGIIIGGSKPSHVEIGITDAAKGHLPDEIVQLLEETWKNVKAGVPLYAL